MSARTSREPFTCETAGQRLSGARIVVERPRSAATLVFLHEGLGAVSLWRDFPDRLCASLELNGLAYDRAGYGLSDPARAPRDLYYLHREARDVLPRVLDTAGIEAPLLLGHSDGGSIALLYAAKNPARCAGAITEAAHVFVEERTLDGIRAAVRAWQCTDLPARLARHHGEKTAATFSAWADTWLSPPFRHWNIETEIRGLLPPLLLLQGADDEYGTPAQLDAIEDSASGPVERYLLPACAHVPHQQACDRVIKLIAEFTRRHIVGSNGAGTCD